MLLCADPYEEAPVVGLEVLQALGLASGGGASGNAGAARSAGARAGANGEPAVRIVAMGPRRPEPAGVQMAWVAATPRDCAGMLRNIALELAKTSEGIEQPPKPGVRAERGAEGGVVGGELDARLGFWATSRKLGVVVGSQLLESRLVYGVLASVLRVCAARTALGAETVPLFLFGRGNARGALELGFLGAEPSAAGDGGVGCAGAPDGAGFSGAVEAAVNGRLRALFVFGADPLAECGGRAEVEQALKKLEFLFVQSDAVNETAELAHVCLPLQGIFDKKGSFMDLEGRLTGLSPQASADGEDSLLFALLRSMQPAAGKSVELRDAETVFAYMKKCYGWNLKETLKSLARSEGAFPGGAAPRRAHPATWLAQRDFEKKQSDARAGGPAREGGTGRAPAPETGGLVLLSGTPGVSQWVWARNVTAHPKIPQSLFVEIPRADAERLAIDDGDTVEVVSSLGRVRAVAALSDSLMPGAVFVPFGFPGAGPGVLSGAGDDVTIVSLEKIGAGAGCSS
jgi:hypothetical protein